MSVVAVVGQLFAFSISVLLARHLSVDAFEAYVVAAALYLLLLALAAQGLDKYALRLMPGKFDRGQWQLAGDYFVFALTRILVGAVVVGILAAIWAREVREFPPGTLRAVYVSCATVPVGVLVHFLSAVLSATGDCVRSAATTLLLVPAVTLALIGIGVAASLEMSGATSIACWAAGWLVALVVVGRWVHLAWTGPRGRISDGSVRPPWRQDAFPFWFHRLAMGVVAQIAVLMLDWLQPSAAATGAYAAAMSLATVAAVLAVSTNRMYGREFSILMERNEYPAIYRVCLHRLQWLLPTLGVFLLVTLLFAPQLMKLFRPEFALEGTAALRILALTTATTVVLGVAPTYLKYQRQSRITFVALGACALLQVGLLLALVPRLEATGAAIAYMLSMLLMYGYLTSVALGQLRRRMRGLPPD